MTIITKNADLTDLCREIDQAGRFSLDLEFIPERTYTAELCLVQVATDSNAYIVDPLLMRDLNPLWERIADPKLLKVLHAGDQDLELVYNASGLIPQNVLDTQIAAGFIGFGYPVGYGKLLQQLLNISLSKTESYTDWSNRPLSESQVEYALDDVRHLLPMFDRMEERLRDMQRLSWVVEECRKYENQKYYERDRMHDFFRIKGANSLNRRSLAVLRELSDWRHEEAYRTNKPLKSILQDGILLEFARRPPKDVTEIQRIRGIRPDQLRQYSKALLQAVRVGMDVPEGELPKWPAAKIPSRREVLMADVLYTLLRIICFDLDIATELVATRGILEALVRQHGEKSLEASTLPILHGWRYDIAGKQLVGMLDGAALKMQFREDEHPVQMEMENTR